VISAILATLLAIHFGFNAVILLALACYFAAAALEKWVKLLNIMHASVPPRGRSRVTTAYRNAGIEA
jgi:hypothetical protein